MTIRTTNLHPDYTVSQIVVRTRKCPLRVLHGEIIDQENDRVVTKFRLRKYGNLYKLEAPIRVRQFVRVAKIVIPSMVGITVSTKCVIDTDLEQIVVKEYPSV